MSPSPPDITVVQTYHVPMQSLEAVKDHAAALRQLREWEQVGIVIDEGPSAVLIVLVRGGEVVGVARFCLPSQDSAAAVGAYRLNGNEVEVRAWQGQTISSQQLVDLGALTAIWRESRGQSTSLSSTEIVEFFGRIEAETRTKGRGPDISAETRRQVIFDAHGRCMFDGCGADLNLDPVTGVRGNFATLAHNVASSEGGARGVLYMSAKLADDAENILLLCDVHHRVVDVVAKADYPAQKLSDMRARFMQAADALLDGLARFPIPSFCVTWPVHQQQIAAPSTNQIAQALAPIGARLQGQANILSDNDEFLRTADPEKLWAYMPSVVDQTAGLVLMQARSRGYRAALFAMGLMPSLVALGAKLGNKCEITPMLRYREGGLWYWPATEPRGAFYDVVGLDDLSAPAREVVVCLALTAELEAMRRTAKTLDLPVVSVIAKSQYMGNGSLGHPSDGNAFRQRMQELLHLLRDTYQVERVHLLPCASNAACVFFGQAFDSYHPELLIYDFTTAGDQMTGRLRISNKSGACVVEQ